MSAPLSGRNEMSAPSGLIYPYNIQYSLHCEVEGLSRQLYWSGGTVPIGAAGCGMRASESDKGEERKLRRLSSLILSTGLEQT